MSTFSAPGHEAHRIKSEQARLIKDHLIEPVRVLARPRPTDIVAVIVARNEALRLPDCLSHHRRLGVKRFAIIDNGSTDESQDFLLTQPDVDIFYIHSGYPRDETSYRLHNHHFSASGDRPFTGGALLHFKMLPDFSQKIDEAIEEKTRWKNAEFYHRYKSGIDDGRLISPLYEGSRHYEGPITLIKCGLMSPIDWPHIGKPAAISRVLAAVSRWRR